MSTRESWQRNWLRRMTLVIPAVAIVVVAPLTGCSTSDEEETGALMDRDRPIYRPTQSGLAREMVELDRRTSEMYRNTGSRAFEREMERRYKSGRRKSEVGMSRPGMSEEDLKAWEALGN